MTLPYFFLMITNYDILLSNIWVIIITWIYLYYSVFLDNILGQSYLSFYPLFFIVERIISDVVGREKKRIFCTINLFNFSSKYTTKKNQYFVKVILEYEVICIFFWTLTCVFNSQALSAYQNVYYEGRYDVIRKHDAVVWCHIDVIKLRHFNSSFFHSMQIIN